MPAFILLSALGLAFVRVQRFEISAFLAGIVYFVATVTYGSPNIAGTVDGRFYMPIFSSWLRSPFCLRTGQWPKLSRGAFRSGALECWRCSCSALLVIRHNQALSPGRSITGLGRSSLRRRQWKITPVRGAEGIHSLLPRRSWHCFIGYRAPLFECPTAEAICSGSDRR